MVLSKLLHRSDPSLSMSAPKQLTLYGVAVRKLPIGKYVQVLRTLEDAPEIILGEAFPECGTMQELLKEIAGLDKNGMLRLLSRLLAIVPEQVCRLLSALFDIPEERLLSAQAADALSLGELAEILEAFWKLNDMTDFFGTVRRLTATADKKSTGSSDGLPSGRPSA